MRGPSSDHRAPPLLSARLSQFALAAVLSLSTLTTPPAHARVLTKAPDTEEGARVFAYVCSACHLGGYNQVRAERTLQEAVLRQNGMLAADAIEYQVINGKNRMPAFENRLSEDDITNVAYYVVEQAQQGWNKEPKYVKYPSKYVPPCHSNPGLTAIQLCLTTGTCGMWHTHSSTPAKSAQPMRMRPSPENSRCALVPCFLRGVGRCQQRQRPPPFAEVMSQPCPSLFARAQRHRVPRSLIVCHVCPFLLRNAVV